MGTIPKIGMPNAKLMQSINAVTLFQILDETADKQNYVVDIQICYRHRSDKEGKENYAYKAEAQGKFYSKKAPGESIEFRIAGDAEKRTKTPYFNFIEITPLGALDVTEEYAEQGRKVLQTFLESYRRHGYRVIGDGSGCGGGGS